MSSDYSVEQAKEDWEPTEILKTTVKFKSRQEIKGKYRIRFAVGESVEDAYTKLTIPTDGDIEYTDSGYTKIDIGL